MVSQIKTIQEIFSSHQIFKIFNKLPVGVIIVNHDKKVIAANEFMKNLFGSAKTRFVGSTFGEIINCINSLEQQTCRADKLCENCQFFRSSIDSVNRDTPQKYKTTIKIKSGGKVVDKSLLISAIQIDIGEDFYQMVFFEDITELENLRKFHDITVRVPELVGNNQAIKDLREQIITLADVDVPVIITGESGTGKEVVARALHKEGHRANKPFISVNCSALQDTLLESELFGHVKGAFTGAVRDHKGRFEMADGGTLFLDEIGDISPAMQVKLLRVLQDGIVEPVGGEKNIHVNVRIISATNKDLQKEIREKRFREDLYYRLCVVPLETPPLRNRPEDIALLADFFLSEFSGKTDHQLYQLSPQVLHIFNTYLWPGNVRELQNVIKHALVHCNGSVVHIRHLPAALREYDKNMGIKFRKKANQKLAIDIVKNAINKSGGSKSKAAELLGISRATLYRFLEKGSL